VSLDLRELGCDVESGDPRPAAGGRQEAAQHLDGGGLPGAVGSEEAEYLTVLDLQRQIENGIEVAEPAAEALGDHDRGRGPRSTHRPMPAPHTPDGTYRSDGRSPLAVA